MAKLKLKPFDLKSALSGAKVATRSGAEVTGLHRFDTASPICLAGVVRGRIETFRADGGYYTTGTNGNDLFLAAEEKTVYVNLVKHPHSGEVYSASYPTLGQANASNGPNTVALAVPITYVE